MPDYDPVAEAEMNLTVAKLERRLVEMKDDGDPDELREVKDDLREARAALRANRTLLSGISLEGDATAAPGTVKASTSVQDN